MRLILTSSPCVIGADRAILSNQNQFVDRLKEAVCNHPNVLFVCADPDDYAGTEEFADVFTEAFFEVGIELKKVWTLDRRNMEKAWDLVYRSDLIVLSGGHAPTQNEFLAECGLKEILADYRGVVMGISAGSMNCATLAYEQPEEPGESCDPDYERFLPGLGLTDVQILPHYQKVKDNILDGRRLYEDITFEDSFGHIFFAFPDGTYLYQDELECLIFGEAYMIRDGIMEQVSKDGECVSLDNL